VTIGPNLVLLSHPKVSVSMLMPDLATQKLTDAFVDRAPVDRVDSDL
jgi:hypothetical protein